MKKLNSTAYTTGAFNFGMLMLRIFAGGLMMNHGYQKLDNFSQYKANFINFLGIGSATSLSLAIFAEFFCALFVIIGLFTRVATIPIMIVMCVALFKAHDANFFGDGELVTLFFGAFLTIFILGPGKASVDGMIGK